MATNEDHSDSGLIATIAIVGGLSVVVIALSMNALVRDEVNHVLEGGTANLDTVRDLKNQQTTALNEPAHYVDKSKGVVSLPIDRAMQLVVADLQKNPQSATPAAPATAAPAGSAAPPGSAAPDGATGAAPAGAAPAGAVPPVMPAGQPGTPKLPAKGSGAGKAPAAPAPAKAPAPTPAPAPGEHAH